MWIFCYSDLEEKSPFGPLTQRLVSALIEENIMAPLDDGNITEAGKSMYYLITSFQHPINLLDLSKAVLIQCGYLYCYC